MARRVSPVIFIMLLLASVVFGQANGKLQLHFIDVGQGDGAVLISPKGETVLFDNGIPDHCDLPLSYLDQLGITKVDYHIASHYHGDHIGCTSQVLETFPLKVAAFDRGGTTYRKKLGQKDAIFDAYTNAVGSKRKEATSGEKILLDSDGINPVVIKFVAMNGEGIETTNENDLSLVCLIKFGKFDAVMGGDLSGNNANGYKNIEGVVAEKVGQVEVYKVHHHGSDNSTSSFWLEKTKPRVAIISASGKIGTNHHHPRLDCMNRLHQFKVKTYWTEQGGGAKPNPEWDVVGGNIVIEVEPNADEFKVKYSNYRSDTYPMWEGTTPEGTQQQAYAWSKKSKIYHYADCKYVPNIAPENLERGGSPPEGKELHKGCPER